MAFTIRLEGEAELQRRLGALINALQDPRPLFAALGATLERHIELRFDTKRDPAGVPWPPLAASTRERYARADGERRQGTLLERTRRMRDSLATNVYPDRLEVGFGVPYAGFHETGTKRMPRRGLLAADPTAGTLGDRDRAALLRTLATFLDNAAR